MGSYLLQSCPAGYELITSAQECVLCPAFSYCPGGITAHVPCSGGLFAPPGSTSSLACLQVVFVVVALEIPIFISEFTSTDEDTLIGSLADVAAVPLGNVVLQSLSESQAGFVSSRAVCLLASMDAISAERLRIRLTGYFQSFQLLGFSGSSLISITVTACAAGFELIIQDGSLTGNDGDCNLCPAFFYCVGGTSERTSCTSGTFAPPGSNSSMSCVPSVIIIVVATLPIPLENFTTSKQGIFIDAISSVTSIAADQVMISSMVPISGRRSATFESIQVQFQLAARDSDSAMTVISNLRAPSFDSKLVSLGLPQAVIESVSSSLPYSSGTSVQPWVIAVCITGGFFMLSLVLALTLWASLRNRGSEEEKLLSNKVLEIRRDLKISRKDGFLLTSERPSFFERHMEIVFLRKSHLEAAARLALSQDFDLQLFNSFCLSLEGESLAGGKDRHRALSEWLLEKAVALIRPDLILEGSVDQKMTTSYSERFRYFVDRVSKARIWAEDLELFSRLQSRAQDFMDEMASLCDLRYNALCLEPRGSELATYSASDSFVMKRQDDPEVTFYRVLP